LRTRPGSPLAWVESLIKKEVGMEITNISEAKASLSYLIKMVRKTGKPIIIGKIGQPVAVLSAFKKDWQT